MAACVVVVDPIAAAVARRLASSVVGRAYRADADVEGHEGAAVGWGVADVRRAVEMAVA